MKRKPVQLAIDVWQRIKRAARKQSRKSNRTITMGDIIDEETKNLD